MNYFLHIISDYGVGDAAFGEVVQKLRSLLPVLTVYPTTVPAFSTLATGFWIGQYALINPFSSLAIYSNTAPRKDGKHKRDGNEGEKFLYAILTNGVPVMAVNAGFVFSVVKPFIRELYEVNVANKGSQFRSRDFYPEAVVGILSGNKEFIGASIDPGLIPDLPLGRVAYIDGYGNIKTTTRLSKITLKSGTKVTLSLNGVSRQAYFAHGTFEVEEGMLSFAPGSSGGTDPFMELFLRGGSAWEFFGKPHVESDFSFVLA